MQLLPMMTPCADTLGSATHTDPSQRTLHGRKHAQCIPVDRHRQQAEKCHVLLHLCSTRRGQQSEVARRRGLRDQVGFQAVCTKWPLYHVSRRRCLEAFRAFRPVLRSAPLFVTDSTATLLLLDGLRRRHPPCCGVQCLGKASNRTITCFASDACFRLTSTTDLQVTYKGLSVDYSIPVNHAKKYWIGTLSQGGCILT